MAIRINKLYVKNMTITRNAIPVAPDGTILYTTSMDGDWTPIAADVVSGVIQPFDGRENAVKVVIPQNDADGNPLTSMASNYFLDCTNLVFVSIPNTIALGDSTFKGCMSLTTLTNPVPYTNPVDGCDYCKVSTIGLNVFDGDLALDINLYISDLTAIRCKNGGGNGRRVFNECGIRRIALPSVTSFESQSDSAFRGMRNIEYVYFPNIGNCSATYGFRNCASGKLVTIDFRGRSNQELPGLADSFFNVSSAGTIIPTILVDKEQEATWKADETWGQYTINPE